MSCMGGGLIVGLAALFVIVGLALAVFAIVVAKFLRSANKPVVSENVDTGLLILTMPAAVFASALAMVSTSHPESGAWRCTFADSIWGQIGFHMLVPLLIVGMSIAAYVKTETLAKPGLRVYCLWTVLGLWGSALTTAVAMHVFPATPALWRVIHYQNIVLICASVFLMPHFGKRVAGGTGVALAAVGYAVLGVVTSLTVVGLGLAWASTWNWLK